MTDITINGHTYTDDDWRSNWLETIRGIASDIAAIQLADDVTAIGHARIADEAAGLVPLPSAKAVEPPRSLKPFPSRALRYEPGTAPFLPYGEA
jgi:hypothetical protein